MRYPGIAAMEWYWLNRNWSYICAYYHSRQGGLRNKISWWISIVLSWKPTKTSAVFDRQLTVLIRNQILQNIPAVMKYRISVTRIVLESNKFIGACVYSRTNQILVPYRSKAQNQQHLQRKWSDHRIIETINISYSGSLRVMIKLTWQIVQSQRYT